MTFLNKTGVAIGLMVLGLLAVLAGCASEPANQTSLHRRLSEWVEAEASSFMQHTGAMCCAVAARDDTYYGASQGYGNRLKNLSNAHGRGFMYSPKFPRSYLRPGCGFTKGEAESDYQDKSGKAAIAVYCLKNEGGDTGYSGTSYMDEAVQRVDSHIASLTKSQNDQLVAERKDAELDAVTGRLEACDSFGFERGTGAHAECAMKLYMNEQNKGVLESSSDQQLAAVARQQAIQEATIKEQKRIQELEASLRMMQFGIDLMNGTTSSPAASQTHSQTYSINGQIIRCTTTGSITTCL